MNEFARDETNFGQNHNMRKNWGMMHTCEHLGYAICVSVCMNTYVRVYICMRRDTKIKVLGAAGRCEHRAAKIESRLYEHRPQRISPARGRSTRSETNGQCDAHDATLGDRATVNMTPGYLRSAARHRTLRGAARHRMSE